ncbi:hypothetical protein [Rhodococcoides kyotonense]|uniref:Uncharacterized protein n=1 Tax=Rhodococcoides kyotonense TaxID=398843 RepID=A0A239HBJ1_9NOCA|nr:hypothetical protein [Rhodococcus kyotonensis]SNS78541.1 hypothetical protein SAMN05421642_105177 [Rhodococcus kyotonensis]
MALIENSSPTAGTVVPTAARSTGILLATATTAWAVGMALIGGHEGFGWQSVVGGATAVAFQIAIIRLLLLQFRTHAMGDGRVARGFYIAQFVFMAGALVSSTLDAFWLLHGTAVWMAFDLFWPLSMLGMVGIGIRIAIAGRWTGIVRWWTLWAQSWFVATIPLVLIVRDAGQIVGSAHLILGYAILGVLLAIRQR